MVGNTRGLAQATTDDLSRYGGGGSVYASHAHPIPHQAASIFSPSPSPSPSPTATASVTASTGFVSNNLASPNKGEQLPTHGHSYPPTPCLPGALKMSPALQSAGSTPGGGGGKKRGSTLLEDKRKRKCWEAEAGTSPKVAIATPTMKSAAKATVPVALTSPTSRRTLSPVVGADLDQVTLSGTLPPHNKSTTYPTVSNKKDSLVPTGPGLSTTSSLRAIRPCKTSEPGSTLPLTSTTTSGIPVGIAVARQRSTSSHVAVTNTTTTSYPDLNSLAGNNGLVGNTGLTATHLSGNAGLTATHLSGNAGLTATHMSSNAGLTATHSLAGNIHAGPANGLHSVAAAMGPGQCLPAMTLLTCDDGNNPNASAWSSPWHYPMPMESPIPQLSHPGNLQLVRDPNSGQFLLLPTASFDPMPGTVVWPAAPPGSGGLILPHPPHPHTTPLILDNRLVALSTPAPPAPLSPTTAGGDKQRRGGPTLVKLDDNSLTGVMMPSNDYSKATLGSDTNGYALIHHSPSFINPNFSAISSSSGSFLIQHISRNNNAPMQMTTAPTLFNNGTRTNNLLISTQQLPAGQQLTLASPSGDMKDNIATICYDNLYHNTTTTTMFNLQQTTSVLNQQTTSTQQMSTTSILVNDKINGNASFNVESQVDTSNFNQVELSGDSVGYNNDMDSGNCDADYCSNQNENSTEDSQTSAGTQDEEEEEAEEELTTKNDAGNQTDMPDEAKADSDECSQDSSVQNDISDKPMSLNNGDENSLSEEREVDETSSCEKDSVEVQDVDATAETEISFKIDPRHVSITPTEKPNGFSEMKNVSTCDNSTNVETDSTPATISILDCDTSNTVNVNGLSRNKKESPSLESKKKIKQMPSLYPIHRFLPNINSDVKSADTRLVGFRSMPLLEDATKLVKKDSKTVSNNEVSYVKTANEDKETVTKDLVADDTSLVVNALMGLGNNSRLFEENNLKAKTEQQKYIGCDKEESHMATDRNGSHKDNHVVVKPTPRVFSVSNLLDKNFSSKNWTSTKLMEQPEAPIREKSDKPPQISESLEESPVDIEQKSGKHNTDCESDEILEVANILCSALFTSGNERSQCPFPDANKAFDSEERSSRNDSESSGTSCESGVDLSGLELLSNSIEQLERSKDGPGSGKVCHREETWTPEDDGVLSDETSHNDSGISRGLDLLCALAQERIQEVSEVSSVPQTRYDSSVWTPRRLTKHNDTPSRWMMSSDTDDEMFIQPYKPRLYKRPPGVPYKEVSHTYRSLKSEQDTRRVLASKQTYAYAPPTSIDLKEMETRRLLAEIQREFREAQKELTRLTPKKGAPHTPPEGGWRGGASCEGAGGGQSGGKRKPGRPRKADKDVESLKHSGKKVRDMITDRSSSPSPAKPGKERVEPRTKLSVQLPSTPSHCTSTQTKSTEQSPPILTPFSNSPLDMMETSRPPTLVKRHEASSSGVAGSYYRGRFLHDDDSDQAEPPQLSPESTSAASRKRGRPPKKQAAPESPPLRPEPVRKPAKPTFVSIVLANKNKQHAKPTAAGGPTSGPTIGPTSGPTSGPTLWDAVDYKPNKIRPKLKAEAKVRTLTIPDSEDDVSDLEDAAEPVLRLTVRKPSLAAGGTHVKISKPPSDVEAFRKSSSQEPPGLKKESSESWSKTCKKQNGQESDAIAVGKMAKKAPSPETNAKKHKHSDSSSSKALNETSGKKHKTDGESAKAAHQTNHDTSAKKHKSGIELDSKVSSNHESSAKKHKLDSEPSKPVNHYESSAKKLKDNESEPSKGSSETQNAKKLKTDGGEQAIESNQESRAAALPKRAELAASEKPPVLPSVKRVKRAESGSSVGSAVSCGGNTVTVPCETEQRECKVTAEYLREHEDASTRVLVLNEGLLYAGQLTAISPPDIYAVQLDGERAHRPNIYSQEEVLRDVILEVKLALSSVTPGRRMCAYWSQQYRCLYPGVVVSDTTSSRGACAAASPSFVNVEFDDGDSGSIRLEDIRALPQDFPLMTYADPLLTLGGASKRRRRNSSASVEEPAGKRRNSSISMEEPPGRERKRRNSSSASVDEPLAREKQLRLDATIVEEEEEEERGESSTAPVRDEKLDVPCGDNKTDGSDARGNKVRSKSHKLKKRKRSREEKREEKREHKKHKKHKHKHRHKEKRRRSSSTELSNSGASVTEEHIKLAIKPIAEIVHIEDPLKIVVKRDVICETHIVSETHKEVVEDHHGVKENGEEVLDGTRVVNVEETESNDSIVTEEKVGGLNEDSVDSVKADDEFVSDKVDGVLVNNVSDIGNVFNVKAKESYVELRDDKVEAVDKLEVPEAKEEAHESLVLTIRTSDACPKILHERKSTEANDSEMKAQPDLCDETDTAINGKANDGKPKKAKKSAKTEKVKCVAIDDKPKKKKQIETVKAGETKVQKKKKSKVSMDEKATCDGKSSNEEKSTTDTEKTIQDDRETKPDPIENIADDSNTNPETLNETADDNPSNSDLASNSDKPRSNSTDKPSNSTEKPSNSAEKPSNSAEKPSNSAEKPSNSTEKPSNSIEKPSNFVDKTSNSTEKPQNSADKPSNSTENPSNSTDKPSALNSPEPSAPKCPAESKARRKSPKAKPSRERQPSVDSKSSMTHFLPEKQLWDWAGTSYKRCTTKRKGRKLFYKSIQRGQECLSVGDCAVFLSTGTDQPYIGKIDGFWESYASMNVKVKWFYHPEETVGCPLTLPCYQGALFEACHFDENDIQTISHKCQVLPLPDYQTRLAETRDPTDLYYLAGLYDHINRKIQFEPGVAPTTPEPGSN